MSNPYTSQSIGASYNQNAPANDGSQVSTNEITWDKHKDKLADPLKTFAEAINSAVSSAFGKIFGNAVSSISTGYTVQTSDQGKLLSATNTITIDLLSAATAGTNFCFGVRNDGSGTVTLDGDSSETIDGSTTVDLAAGDWAILVSDGTNWSTWSLVQANLSIATSQITDLQRKHKTADETVNNSDTLQDDDDLAGYSLTAGEYYQINGFLYVNSDTTADFQLAMTFTNAPQELVLSVDAGGAATAGILTTATAGNGLSVAFTSGGNAPLHIKGFIKANASTGGTVDLQWAQDTANPSDTKVLDGSWLELSV